MILSIIGIGIGIGIVVVAAAYGLDQQLGILRGALHVAHRLHSEEGQYPFLKRIPVNDGY